MINYYLILNIIKKGIVIKPRISQKCYTTEKYSLYVFSMLRILFLRKLEYQASVRWHTELNVGTGTLLENLYVLWSEFLRIPEHGDPTLVAQMKKLNKIATMAISLFSIACYQPKHLLSYETHVSLLQPLMLMFESFCLCSRKDLQNQIAIKHGGIMFFLDNIILWICRCKIFLPDKLWFSG